MNDLVRSRRSDRVKGIRVRTRVARTKYTGQLVVGSLLVGLLALVPLSSLLLRRASRCDVRSRLVKPDT